MTTSTRPLGNESYIWNFSHAILLLTVAIEFLGLLFHGLLDHPNLLHLVCDLLFLVLYLLEVCLELFLLVL